MEQISKFIGMFFLDCQNGFEHFAGGRIVGAEIGDQVAVAVDGDPFGHQVFVDPVLKLEAFYVLRVASVDKTRWGEVRSASKLHNSLCQKVGVAKFFVGVVQKFGSNSRRKNSF